MGLKLGLIGFVSYSRKVSFIAIIYCIIDIYVFFGLFEDWLCIGFELGLIGFVFLPRQRDKIFISHFIIDVYVHLGIRKIGFVLHKKG